MAKVSKINIAITGDSKGLAAATDAATRELRRLEAQTEKTTKRIAASQKTLTKTAESMSKLGASSKALGAVGGVLGLTQIAMTGGPLGTAAVAGGLAIGGAGLTYAAGQQIADISQRAAKALQEVKMDARKRIEETGFSTALAQAIANQGNPYKSAGQNLGVIDSFLAGLSATKLGSYLSTYGNVANSAATQWGAMLGGAGWNEANRLANAQLLTGDKVQDAQFMQNVAAMQSSPFGPFGYFFQSEASK